jgi:hypothetical protein
MLAEARNRIPKAIGYSGCEVVAYGKVLWCPTFSIRDEMKMAPQLLISYA